MQKIEGPSAILVAARKDDLDSFVHSVVGFDAGVAQIVEPAQDVIVPVCGIGEPQPAFVDDVAGP